MRRLAFSLVELLTIVAIVVVLSSILFPVFRQAAAQGRHSNEFNLKKMSHALDMYSRDYDDAIIITSNGRYRNLLNIHDGVLSNYGEQRTDQWPLLLEPYLKDRQLYVDPERGDQWGIYSTPPHAVGDPGYDFQGATYRNQNRFPMFGLNYLFISPYKIPASKLADATPTDYMVAEPHTFAEADDPANTVFYTVSDRGYIPTTTTDVIGTLDATRGFWAVDAPGIWTALVASNQPYVAFWDGTDCSGDWCGADVDPGMAGVQTRENFFYKAVGTTGNNVMFLDGHIKFRTALQLAAGTDYPTAPPDDGGTTYFGGGAHITDKSQYLWNLNDFYFGL